LPSGLGVQCGFRLCEAVLPENARGVAGREFRSRHHGDWVPARRNTGGIKVAEAEQALRDGGVELDMVVNIGKVPSEDWEYVRQDIRAAADAAHGAGPEGEADFVKTSTGYGSGGATIAALKLMRRHSPPNVQVKAAGGIRTLDALLDVRAIGVARSGATRTAEMLTKRKRRIKDNVKDSATV
jgi:deoxyribose-phosphate aldolase